MQTVKVNNRPLYLYFLLQLLVVALIFLAISVPEWFVYCWFQFGIGSARSVGIPGTDFEEHLYVLHYTMCNWMPHSVPEAYCPGFCDSIKRLEHASGALLFFLVYSAALGLVSGVLHLYLSRIRDFQCPSIRLLIASPALMMLTGFGVYCVIAEFQQFEEVKGSSDLCSDNQPSDFTPKWGLLLSVAMILLQLLTVLYGVVETSKMFKVGKK